MKKIALLTILWSLVLVVPAFAQPATKWEDFYPLKVKSRWTYRAIDVKTAQPNTDQKRLVVIEIEREEPYVRSTVDKDNKTTDEKFPGFILKSTSGGKTTRDHVVLMKDGLQKVNVAGTSMTPPLLFFKFGLKPGMTWDVSSTSGNTKINGTFTLGADLVSVPQGKHNAFKVSYTNNKPAEERVENEWWFVHNVGMVKQRIKSKEHEIVLELEKYEPAK